MDDTADYAVSIIPIKRSVIFWEASEVCGWFEALQFDAQVSSTLMMVATPAFFRKQGQSLPT